MRNTHSITRILAWPLLSLLILSSCGPMKSANKAFERGQYEVAIPLYEKAARNSKYTAEANFQIGECFRLTNRMRESRPFYENAIDADYYDEAAEFYLAFSMKANEEYEEAQSQLDDYLTAATNFEYIERAKLESQNLDVVQNLLGEDSYYRVKNLEAINTPAAEYSPVYNKGELFFTRATGGGKVSKATGLAQTDLYKVKINGARPDMETLEMLDDLINDPLVNEGSITFSPDGSVMVFAKGNRGGRRGDEEVNLFETRYTRRGTWTEPRMIRASDPRSWDSGPTFSSDGRTLYFASNRENGYGGTDIYAATRDGRGRWGNVRNMGNKINTPGNEVFPYASPDGKLYFSSTGHPGLGGFDLFVAVRQRGQIAIQNLGVPINSAADDFGLFLFDPAKGFFTSNRPGGQGDDDIYTFVNNDPDLKVVNYYLAGIAYEAADTDGQIENKPLSGTHIKLIGEDGSVLEETYTTNTGQFEFRVYPEEDYELIADKQPTHFTAREAFSTVGRSVDKSTLTELVTNRTFNQDLVLNPIVKDQSFVLENILFAFNSADINNASAIELDKLVQILEDNPQIRIELSAHTDSVGSNADNLLLSQRRAESAVNFIIERGIDQDRIYSRGYGETQPIARNTNPDGTDNPDGRAKNRRVEFKVVEITEVVNSEEDSDNAGDADDDPEDRYFQGSGGG